MIITIHFNEYIIEEMVIKLNPTYIGFLLILYIPFVFKEVSSDGIPKRVDLPRFTRLITVNNNPTKSRNAEM